MKIRLTQNKFCEVDAENFGWLNLFSWSAERNGQTFYARTNIDGRSVRMHNYICDTASGYVTDHRNRNGLDNHLLNLRICTQAQNCRNSHRTNGASKYRGVVKSGDKWQARISFEGKRLNLGDYDTPELAARAFRFAAERLFGAYAYQNPIVPKNTTGRLF